MDALEYSRGSNLDVALSEARIAAGPLVVPECHPSANPPRTLPQPVVSGHSVPLAAGRGRWPCSPLVPPGLCFEALVRCWIAPQLHPALAFPRAGQIGPRFSSSPAPIGREG